MRRSALAFVSRPEAEAGRTRPTLYVEPMSETRARLSGLDDSALISAYLCGCDAAFTQLHDKYIGRVTSYIARMTGDREQAEDLAQETFIRVYRNLARFNQTKKFSTWIYTIAGNLAINELRNRSRRQFANVPASILTNAEGDEHNSALADPKNSTEKVTHDRHLHELVDQTVLKLQDYQRQAFVLREIEGKTYREIADICDCNIGTIKSRLNRARIAFAAFIGPWLD